MRPSRKSLICSPAGLLALVVALAASLLSSHAFAIDIPPLGVIPVAVAEANPSLVTQRAALQTERNGLRARKNSHNGVCSEVNESDPKLESCTQELQILTQDVERHVEASNRFNAALARALKAGSSYAVMPASILGEVYAVTADGHKIPIDEHRLFTIDTLTTIVVGPTGRVQFLLPDETVFTLGPNSEMLMDKFVFNPKTSSSAFIASIAKGSFRFASGKAQHKLDKLLKLAVGTIGPRGTEFEGDVSADGSGYVKLFSGELLITPKDGTPEFILKSGQMVRFTHDKLEAPETIPASG